MVCSTLATVGFSIFFGVVQKFVGLCCPCMLCEVVRMASMKRKHVGFSLGKFAWPFQTPNYKVACIKRTHSPQVQTAKMRILLRFKFCSLKSRLLAGSLEESLSGKEVPNVAKALRLLRLYSASDSNLVSPGKRTSLQLQQYICEGTFPVLQFQTCRKMAMALLPKA